MTLTIKNLPSEKLPDYASIPMSLEVKTIFAIKEAGLEGIKFQEIPVTPYQKDYDQEMSIKAIDLPNVFDLSNWGMFVIYDSAKPVAGAIVAFKTKGVDMLDGRDDLAVLWGIRVHPDYKNKGLGTQLFQHMIHWARERNCIQIKIETQNVNVPACRFYAKQGCYLGKIDRFAYWDEPEFREEVELFWYLDI